MKKSTRDWLIVSVLGMLCASMVYGAQAWFFPSDIYVRIVTLPILIPGLYACYWLWSKAPPVVTTDRSQIRKRFFGLLVLLFVPAALWFGLALGPPALALELLGRNGKRIDTVASKETGSKSCRYRVQFVGLKNFLNDDLCVSSSEFNSISVGQSVSLNVRESFFGTRVFSFTPSKQLLELNR